MPNAPRGGADAETRKADHLRVVLTKDVAHQSLTTGLEHHRLRATCLPGRALAEVELSMEVFGRRLDAPLLISCMTGGVGEAGPVNRALAHAAQQHRIALGLGSGRVLLEGGDPESFLVREVAPDVLLLANLGAVQLPEVGVDGCAELVARTEADVLVLHLNAVQEAVQPGGDTDFVGLLGHISAVTDALDVPIVVKEVGFGMSAEDITALTRAGVAGIDVAGAGGTNWARVEGHRDSDAGLVAAAFADWGWSTSESLAAARKVLAGTEDGSRPVVIASGGLAHGVDAVKALCLGADLAGFGRRLLAPATEGAAEAARHLNALVEQVRIATWGVGAESVTALGTQHLHQQP